MKKKVVSQTHAFLYLHKDIYSKEVILEALNDYEEFIVPSLKEFGKYVTLKIETNQNEFTIPSLTDEFINYLTALEFNNLKTQK